MVDPIPLTLHIPVLHSFYLQRLDFGAQGSVRIMSPSWPLQNSNSGVADDIGRPTDGAALETLALNPRP